MQALFSTMTELTIGSATRALNKRANKVSQSRSRTDSLVSIAEEHVHSSLSPPHCDNDNEDDEKLTQGTLSPSTSTASLAESALSVSPYPSPCSVSVEEVQRLFLSTYEVQELLGRGASATVHAARHRLSRERFAVKTISRDEKMNDSLSMRTEVLVMKKLSHSNVVRLLELYETRDEVHMVIELADKGGLLGTLSELPLYSEAAIAPLFRQLLLGVQYLHSKGVVHRDLKMDNLLCCTVHDKAEKTERIVKIADFGLSALTIKREEREGERVTAYKRLNNLREAWGTAEYVAPEVLRRRYGFQADIWSLGCLLYEMLTGELAFPCRETPVTLYERIVRHGGRKPPREFERRAGWSALSESAKALIKSMLKVNPVRRLDIDECLCHPWVSPQNSAALSERELSVARKAIQDRAQRKKIRFDILARQAAEAEASNAAVQAKE